MQRLNCWTVIRYTAPTSMFGTIYGSYMTTLDSTSMAKSIIEDTTTSSLWVVGSVYISSVYYQTFTNLDKVTGAVLSNTGTSWGANSDMPNFKSFAYVSP